MTTTKANTWRTVLIAVALAAIQACGGGGDSPREEAQAAASTPLPDFGPNMVSRWATIASATYFGIAPGTPGTPEEANPLWSSDFATVHLAMYDAAMAIARTHKPFAVVPAAPSQGASMDAAVMAAAHGVLRGLYPSRAAVYQPAYEAMVLQLPADDATTRGIALGSEVAGRMLALRANDGRAVVLAPFVPGTQPGDFRGTNPVARFVPYVKPFSIQSASQFRADGPSSLPSGTYAEDLAEVQALGRDDSTVRTAEQTLAARFHTEPPQLYWIRNLNHFATSQPTLAANARLAAMLWASVADTVVGCFESKYHYLFWRPASAIRLADTDGNDATVADKAWTPLGPVPNHPEYPAAHACIDGSVAEVLTQAFGTKKLSFTFNSLATGTTQTYASVQDMVEITSNARLWGGMHLRTSLVHGRVLGMQTTKWVLRHHFEPSE